MSRLTWKRVYFGKFFLRLEKHDFRQNDLLLEGFVDIFGRRMLLIEDVFIDENAVKAASSITSVVMIFDDLVESREILLVFLGFVVLSVFLLERVLMVAIILLFLSNSEFELIKIDISLFIVLSKAALLVAFNF